MNYIVRNVKMLDGIVRPCIVGGSEPQPGDHVCIRGAGDSFLERIFDRLDPADYGNNTPRCIVSSPEANWCTSLDPKAVMLKFHGPIAEGFPWLIEGGIIYGNDNLVKEFLISLL